MARDFDLAKLLTDNGLRTTVDVDVSFDSGTLFVDADTNRVGIATTTPSYNLEVNGSLNSTSLYIGGTQVTSTATELNLLDGVTATTAEINYLDGVTSNIQTQIDNISSSFTISDNQGTPNTDTVTTGQTLTFAGSTGIDTTVSDNQVSIAIDSTVATLTGSQTLTNKTITSPSISDPTLTGTTTYATLNDGTTSLTATVAELNTLDGITATVTELNYTDGVTSAIQTQLDAKAPLASPALTGTATAVNLTVSGNLTVNGTTVTNNADNLLVDDALIELNHSLTGTNASDLGIVMERGTTGDNAFMGWDETNDRFLLGTTTATGASTGSLTVTPGTLNIGTLQIGGTSVTATASELNVLDGITATVTELNYTDGVTSNIQTQLDAKLASSSYTAADVLTKIKTVDGAGSGLDADTLDGIDSGSFLRSDATDTFTTLNGTQIGIGSQIILTESTDRADLLLIQSQTSSWGGIQIQNSSGETLTSFMGNDTSFGIYDDQQNEWTILCNENGDVSLYHNGSVKLSTTSTGVSVTGDITVSGTVDGRDIATDGTKLDGIESGATADQTASEILTAIKTVDGSGSGLDADLLDGLDSGSFLRSDASDTQTAGSIAFGRAVIDPDSYAAYSGGFGNIQDGSGWGATGLFIHGGSTGDAAAIGHNGGGLYFGIQNNSAGNSMATWLTVSPSTRVAAFDASPTAAGHTIWHAGNDGSGSGLDADLLDGQQGSYYYSPANPPSVSSTFDGLTSKTSGTGTYQTSGDFRAPIFYDSDNTAYYVNPASTSTLRGLDVAGNDVTDAAYHRAAIEVREYNFGGAQTDSWAYAPRIGMHWGGRVASQIALASDGRIHILNNPGNANEDLQCDNFYSVNMYDKDNTAYYIDAHATSNINRLILDGRIPLMWHSRGETSTTTNRSLTTTYVTHLSLGGVVVPSGYTGYIFIEVNMGNNYENGNGQYTYRIQATGPATLYSQDHDGGWGYHNNFNPRSTKIFRMTLSTAGTYTLNLQAVLATGSVTLNQYNSIDYLGYELFIQRN